MAAEIKFYDSNGIYEIGTASGSGIAFFGSGGAFTSIPIGSYNSYSFLSNSLGTSSGQQINNVSKTANASGSLNGSGSISLLAIPNYLSTLRIQFTNDSPVRTLNPVVRIYDRSSINNPPSGVNCYVASVIHPSQTQIANGSGSSGWSLVAGSGTTLAMHTSPGLSGLSPSGSSSVSATHHWFAAISPTPTSIGSKTQFGLYFSTEFL